MISGNRLKKISLAAGDAVAFYASLFLALTVRYWSFPGQELWEIHRGPFLFVNALWILILYISGFYDPNKFINSTKILAVLKTMAIGAGGAILIFYFIPYFNIAPKTNLFIDAAFSSMLLWGWRNFFKLVSIKSHKIKVFFLGESKETMEFKDFLDVNPHLGYKTVGDAEAADIIVATEESKQDKETVKTLYEKVLAGKTIMEFSRLYESLTGKVPVSAISKAWFMENLLEINKQSFEKVKKWLDLALTVVVFSLFAATFPFVALAIKTTSPGPIFYRQKRAGKNGEPIEIIKYRSMVKDAEKNGAEWAKAKDNRVTIIGNFLRKTRIDELPQVINVAKGELSFVGPRPERPEFTAELAKKIPYYPMRQLIKPGLTGWAQINFPYGASIEDATQKLQYDLYYVKNRSLPLEISILLKTIMTILRREGR
ncbi:MAG: sugar transferase [Candidatus Pacebacteria bacterium]|nr:sugar transferase [Candidatus Paceibacterota bacterium]NUQ57538.1 sugar transferase [Candidatus Paceibacter sp.]